MTNSIRNLQGEIILKSPMGEQVSIENDFLYIYLPTVNQICFMSLVGYLERKNNKYISLSAYKIIATPVDQLETIKKFKTLILDYNEIPNVNEKITMCKAETTYYHNFNTIMCASDNLEFEGNLIRNHYTVYFTNESDYFKYLTCK